METVGEIKNCVKMTDVLMRYGMVPNRAGFIKCPFHSGDNSPSLKVYKDSYHCYACGANGDIFTFVMAMDKIGFKEAFLALGGSYEKGESLAAKRQRMRKILAAQQARERELAKRERLRAEMHVLSRKLNELQGNIKEFLPFSDEWCAAQNEFPQTYGRWLDLWEEVTKGE